MHLTRVRADHGRSAGSVVPVGMAISEQEYQARALPELDALLRALDEAAGDGFEVELESDILTVEFSDGARYVVNSHRAARQIWMAAEHSAWHFDYDAGADRWIAHKTGDELWATVEKTLSARLGKPFDLRRST